MSDEFEPTPVTPPEDEPMWKSDAAEREAKRRKMMVFGGSAIGVLVGFVGLYALLNFVAGGLTDDPDDRRSDVTIAIGGGGSADVEAPPAVAEPIATAGDLEWYAVEATLGHSQRLFATDTGTFYALSTVPGQAINWPVPKAIYKSGDGENWEIIDLDNAISANDMATGSNKLYLIGTTPSSGNFFDEPPEIIVSTTADDGATWAQNLLPTVAAPPGGAPIEWANVSTKIAANDNAVVAVAQSRFFLDYRQIVPAEFSGDMFGYNATDDGVSVMDYQIMEEMYGVCEGEMSAAGDDFEAMSEECQALFNGDESIAEIGFVTWEEMGLAEGGQPQFSEMFISTDGENFEAVESPFSTSSEIANLFALPDGFIGVEFGRGNPKVWSSDDGRTWVDADVPRLNWITNAGSIDGKTVIVGQDNQSSKLLWENEAGGWDEVDFDAILGVGAAGNRWLSSAGMGPMGVVAVFQSFDERNEREFTEVLLGTSPDDWSIVPIQDITGMTGGYSSWVAVSHDTILIRYEVFNRNRPLSLQVIGARTN